MSHPHHYELTVQWTGNTGSGTSTYRAYERSHVVQAGHKPPLFGSADPAFRGDASCYNPEDLLVASLASCHLLWYLHLCADAGVVVLAYRDAATGIMVETPRGGGRFQEISLRPVVTVAAATMLEQATQLHALAHERCFIANSVNFPVYLYPVSQLATPLSPELSPAAASPLA